MKTPIKVNATINPQNANNGFPVDGSPVIGLKYPKTPIAPIATAKNIIPVEADLPVHIAAKIIMKMNGIGTPKNVPNWSVNPVTANVPFPVPKLVNARI